jgi:nucleoside-diphosphate-sugar epimerase
VQIAVTGGAGFIGSHLCAALAGGGHRVIALDSLTGERHPGNLDVLAGREEITLVVGDVRVPEPWIEARSSDAVIHLAGLGGARVGDEARLWEANVAPARATIEAASRYGIRRVVHVSSSSVYRPSPEPLREDGALAPVAPYGRAKLAAETEARRSAALLGVELVVVRPFTVYGPRQRPDMAFARYLRAAREATSMPRYGDGMQRRDFTYVDDLVDGLTRAVERARPGSTLNLSGGWSVTLGRALALLAEVAEIEPPRLEPASAGIPEPHSTRADLRRAAAELGYQPRISLAEGLSRQAAYAIMGDDERTVTAGA